MKRFVDICRFTALTVVCSLMGCRGIWLDGKEPPESIWGTLHQVVETDLREIAGNIPISLQQSLSMQAIVALSDEEAELLKLGPATVAGQWYIIKCVRGGDGQFVILANDDMSTLIVNFDSVRRPQPVRTGFIVLRLKRKPAHVYSVM